MNYWILFGVLLVVCGFVFKVDAILTVVVAAIVTGLIAGQGPLDVLVLLGQAFKGARYMGLFVLTLPVIALAERYGLRDRATEWIQRLSKLTTGRLLWLYQLIREVTVALSVTLGGHPQMVRPLIEPMAQGAAKAKGEINDHLSDEIKQAAAASDNIGNFFAQNIFYAAPGVLLIVGSLKEAGYEVTSSQVALSSVPVAFIALIISGIRTYLLDKKVRRLVGKESKQ